MNKIKEVLWMIWGAVLIVAGLALFYWMSLV